MIEGILIACLNHLAVKLHLLFLLSANFSKKPLGAMCFVMANLGVKFKPKNKNREASVPIML